MPEDKKPPPSIDLGLFDDEEKPPSTVNLGIEGTLPLASMESEDDEESTESDESFSGSVSTTEPESADSGELRHRWEGSPEGKMNKKDFYLGAITPIVLIFVAILIYGWIEGVNEWEYVYGVEDSRGVANFNGDSGNFTVDPLDIGIDCIEYPDAVFSTNFYNGKGYAYLHTKTYCGAKWTINHRAFVGYWEDNGTLNLSLPYPPENGTEVIVGWNNSANATSIGTGDGVRTNFSVDAGERDGGPFDEWTFLGKYERQPVENGWDEVEVYGTWEGLWWRNEANQSWRLYWWHDSSWGPPNEDRSWHPNSCENDSYSEQRSGSLWTGEESPHGEQVLIYNGDSFDGLCFNGEFYTLIEGEEMGARYDHCSELTIELVDEEGNQTDYWNGGEFGSCYSNMDNPESPESANEDAWSLILSMDDELASDFGISGPMSFHIHAGDEEIQSIEVNWYSTSLAKDIRDANLAVSQEEQEFEDILDGSFTLLLVLGIPAMLVAAVVTGHKWFTYGFLATAIATPVIFVVGCFGFFMLFW